MKEHMKYIIDHAEEIEKLIKVKAQVSEVKSIMLENIDKVCLSLRVRREIFGIFSVISLCSCLVHPGLLAFNPLLCMLPLLR